jgi:Tfp pilus assembly PilM family ATPase
LIHIGAQNTSISLLQNGVSIFNGDLSTGGAYFTDSLAQRLHISPQQAESFKITGRAEQAQGVDLETLLRPTVEELAEEIRRTVSLYGAVPSDEGERGRRQAHWAAVFVGRKNGCSGKDQRAVSRFQRE